MKKLLLILFLALSINAKIICVDKTLSVNNTHTYSAATRLSGSGSMWAFKTVQMATDSMSKGDTVQMRGGLYQEGAILFSTGGTSWTTGNFNTLMSYPNEWAIIDGQDSIVSKVGDWASVIDVGIDNNYWQLIDLEIKRGRTLDRTNIKNTACGIQAWRGSYKFKHLYIHNNQTDYEGNNPGGILIHAAQKCTTEYCYFKSNGGNSFSGGNAAHIQEFSDYDYTNIATNGFKPTDNSGYHSMQNVYRYNYFGDSAYFGIKQKMPQFFTGRSKSSGHSFQDTFCSYGDKIYNNIFQTKFSPVNLNQDFVQFTNNVVDAQLLMEVGDQYNIYKTSIYNNTFIKSGINYKCFNIDTPSHPETLIYGYIFNNIIDSGYSYSDKLNLTMHLQSALSVMKFDSLRFIKNYTHMPRIDAYNTDGTKLVYKGVFENPQDAYKYTIAQYRVVDPQFKHYYNQIGTSIYQSTTGPGVYKTIGSYVINGDTTIANGGIGGNHPYLSITLPGYIGATNPDNSNLWVDTVLSLPQYFSFVQTYGDTTSDTLTNCGDTAWYKCTLTSGYRIDSVHIISGTGSVGVRDVDTVWCKPATGQTVLSQVYFDNSIPVIDSIKNKIVLRGKRFTVYGKNFGSSIGTVKINALICGITQWFDNAENDSVWATIPSSAPAGLYSTVTLTTTMPGVSPATSGPIRVSVPTPIIQR